MNIKAYYKACTTSKKYIVIEDISTNFKCEIITCTNNIDRFTIDESIIILQTDDFRFNIAKLEECRDVLISSWTKYCYDYEWKEFLALYELTEYQYNQINKLLKDNQC